MSHHVHEPRNYREQPPVCHRCGEAFKQPLTSAVDDHYFYAAAPVPDLLAALRAETAARIARGGAA